MASSSGGSPPMANEPAAAPTAPSGDPGSDRRWMQAALALARRGLGNVWPNPAVGCVIVNDGRVVGRGWTQPGGRPHAETEALRRAGPKARGATAYVSLEPCNHWGRTPPCAEALIEAGVRRVVVALEDPDPRVAGAGLRRLRRSRDRGRDRARRRRGCRNQRRLSHPPAARPPACHAEACDLARRTHRHQRRRQPVDHRPPGARAGTSAARRARRDHGRHRHRPRRRPATDLPAAGA